MTPALALGQVAEQEAVPFFVMQQLCLGVVKEVMQRRGEGAGPLLAFVLALREIGWWCGLFYLCLPLIVSIKMDAPDK